MKEYGVHIRGIHALVQFVTIFFDLYAYLEQQSRIYAFLEQYLFTAKGLKHY